MSDFILPILSLQSSTTSLLLSVGEVYLKNVFKNKILFVDGIRWQMEDHFLKVSNIIVILKSVIGKELSR